MNWLEVASKMVEQNNDGVKIAPLSNIAGADIKFDKGYGTIKINVPADVADDLTNGSRKYVGGFLLLDRETYEKMKGGLIIKTLEGEHLASIGDYIIKGVKGEFYPCKPDIFEQTYEALKGGK